MTKVAFVGVVLLIVSGLARAQDTERLGSAAPTSVPSPSAVMGGAKGTKTKKSTKEKSTSKPKAESSASSFIPELLLEVEAKYKAAETLDAKFTQINESASLKQKKTSEGTIRVKRPNKIRWETEKPDKSLLVSDGKTAWFYTPPFDDSEPGQVIKRRASMIQSALANALLSGSFSATRDMKISVDGATRFTLTPKKGTAGTIKSAHIEIEPRSKLIQKVVIEHKGGNRSDITLSSIELGKSQPDDLYTFTVPKGADVLSQ